MLLSPDEVAARAALLQARLRACDLCPRRCGVDRTEGPGGVCRTGAQASVSAAFPHFGEETVLVGRGGSGTIFFTGCNLGCAFCQNREVSHGSEGRVVSDRDLAGLMLGLQAAGAENINLVTPSHVVPSILSALAMAARAGLTLPVVWNTSSYEDVATLRYLDGIVDIYLPDFKAMSREACAAWMKAKDYPEVAAAAIAEMWRQVGRLVVDNGVARRGVIVRHLVMPGMGKDAEKVMQRLASVAPSCHVNVMAQYRPVGDSCFKLGIGRRPTMTEVASAREAARAAGLEVLE